MPGARAMIATGQVSASFAKRRVPLADLVEIDFGVGEVDGDLDAAELRLVRRLQPFVELATVAPGPDEVPDDATRGLEIVD